VWDTITKRKGVIALSGGADSTTLLYLAMTECKNLHAISIDYGQRHNKELKCAEKLCKEHNIPHTIIPLPSLGSFGGSPLVDTNIEVPSQSDFKQSSTVVPFRNSFITLIAAAYAKAHDLNTIYMGATYEDLENYEDCRPIFFESLENTLRLGGTIHDLEIRVPFINMTKQSIVRLGSIIFKVPYENTWTCYQGGEKPCMICDACRERMESFRLNGFRDPLISQDEWNKYLKEFESVIQKSKEIKE